MILGADLSHFQPNPNFAQVKASGRPFVVLKATEGTSYTDPSMAARRAAAHAAGLVVGLYHFARAGDPTAEAAWFLRAVGALQPGEFLVLDWEVPAANPPAWCKAWLDAVYAATGVRPFIYMNSSAMTGSNWSTVVAGNYGLWLAKYDNSTAPPAVKWWPAAAMKQFSDAGNVPGIGTCDVNVFYGDEAALLRYGHQGDDMTPEQDARLANVEAVLGRLEVAISDPTSGIHPRVTDVHGKVVDARYGLTDRPGPDADDMLGQILSQRAELRALAKQPAGSVDAQALADALVANPDAVGKLADALAAALAQRLQS